MPPPTPPLPLLVPSDGNAPSTVVDALSTPTIVSPIGPFQDIIDPLIPHGSISTFAGASGVGKTAFLASMIRKLQSHEPLWDFPTHTPPAIGMIACDRPWRDHAKWFAKAGCEDFPHFSLRDEPYNWELLKTSSNIPAVFGSLLDRLKLPPGGLAIIDPVSLFIPGRLHDYKDVAIGIGLLDAQLKQRELTCIGVFHVGKQKGNFQDRYARPQDRILGSTALIGYSETAFYLLDPQDTGKRTYELGIVSHQAKPLAFNYIRDENGLFVPAEIFDDIQEQERAMSIVPLDGAVITSALWQVGIQRVLNCSLRTAERLMRDLRRDGRVLRVGNGKFRRAVPQ